MVFGESGGGAKTSCIYALPLAKDYFNKASIESGPGVHMTPRDMATETARMVLTELGLSEKEVLKLKDVPAGETRGGSGRSGEKGPGKSDAHRREKRHGGGTPGRLRSRGRWDLPSARSF